MHLCWLCLKNKISTANSINLDHMADYILNDHIMISTFLMFLRKSPQKLFSASIFKSHRKLESLCNDLSLACRQDYTYVIPNRKLEHSENIFKTALMCTKYLHQKCQQKEEKKAGRVKDNHIIFEGLLTSLTFPSLWLKAFCSFGLSFSFILFSFLFSFLWV